MNRALFLSMTVEDLVFFFEKNTVVEAETIFNISPEKMKELIEISNLQEKIKGMFREALREIEKQKSDFIIGRSMKIKNLAEILDISKEEIKETFKRIIKRNKKEDPSNCLALAIQEDISINPQEFQGIVNGFLRRANNEDGDKRMMSVITARTVYSALHKKYGDAGIGAGIKMIDIIEDFNVHGDKGEDKIIKAASKILGFKYKWRKPRWNTHHIGW